MHQSLKLFSRVTDTACRFSQFGSTRSTVSGSPGANPGIYPCSLKKSSYALGGPFRHGVSVASKEFLRSPSYAVATSKSRKPSAHASAIQAEAWLPTIAGQSPKTTANEGIQPF